jgi:hypothetical protein
VADAARKSCIAANREDEWLYWRAAAAHAARDWDRAVQWAGEAARKNPTSPLAGEALRLETAAHAAAAVHAPMHGALQEPGSGSLSEQAAGSMRAAGSGGGVR